MQHVILKFHKLQIAIAAGALQRMMEYCQHDPTSREACGILLGFEWDSFSEIAAATPPQITDQRSRYGYMRDTEGHLAIAKDLWRKSNGKIGYLGEWHTHPQRVPSPSQRDFAEAIKLSIKNTAPVFSMILGTTHGCGFVASESNLSPVKRFNLAPLRRALSPQHRRPLPYLTGTVIGTQNSTVLF